VSSAPAEATVALEAVPEADDGVIGFASRALGSSLNLFVRTPPGCESAATTSAPRQAWAVVQAEFAAVDAALSRFRADSELTSLNRLAGTGGVALVSWRLRTMLAAAHRARCLTDGRFDASVVDVLEHLGEHGAERLAPAPAVPRRGDRVELVPPSTPRASLVQIPRRPVDSGGIGKGLALRWAAAAAMAAVPPEAGILVNAGGDIMSGGEPPVGGWRIGVDDPITPAGAAAPPLAVYALLGGGVSTSSVAVRNWTAPDGQRVHHLVDPATRAPARTGLIAVSVAGPDPAWNEVWTKALFLGGSESIGEEARRRGMAAWWVDARGRLGMTPEARVLSAWISEERVG
jgi:FAD:protein FMN transferase